MVYGRVVQFTVGGLSYDGDGRLMLVTNTTTLLHSYFDQDIRAGDACARVITGLTFRFSVLSDKALKVVVDLV